MTALAGDDAARPDWMAGRIPSLDGLRAISIILVTCAHVVPAAGTPFPASWHGIDRYGAVGVNVFFVISGFLITHLLFREIGSHGRISLGGFYSRRMYRILPAYLTLLATAAYLSTLGLAYVDPRGWLPALTFTWAIIPGLDERTIGQVWSLSVEEHFYLIWPITLVILGRKHAPMALIAMILVAPALRFLIWEESPWGIDGDFFTPTRMDTIAVGCLLAYFAHSPRGRELSVRIEGRGDALALAGIAGVLISKEVLSLSGKYILGPGPAIEATATSLVIFAMISDPRSILGRLLNSRPVVAIGVLSYSLYLGQTFGVLGEVPELAAKLVVELPPGHPVRRRLLLPRRAPIPRVEGSAI